MKDSAIRKKNRGEGFFDRESSFRIIVFILLCFVLSRALMYFLYVAVRHDQDWWRCIDSYNNWDCWWYERYANGILDGDIASHVGQNGQRMWAFFPLYPLIISFFTHITDREVHVKLIGTVISNICFLLSQFVAAKYILRTGRKMKTVYAYIFFLSMGLYSFYFSVTYTESLFLLLLCLCYYFMIKKAYIRMGICGMLLSATRNAGVMFVFVILAYVITDYIRSFERSEDKKIGDGAVRMLTAAEPEVAETEPSGTGAVGTEVVSMEDSPEQIRNSEDAEPGGTDGAEKKIGDDITEPEVSGRTESRPTIRGFLRTVLTDSRLIFGTALVPLGLFANMLFLKLYLGDGLAFVNVERAWWRTDRGVAEVIRDEVVDRFPASYLGIMFIIIVYLIGCIIFHRKMIYEAVLPLIMVFLSASSSLMSFPRFFVALLTVVLCFSEEYLKASRYTKVALLILVLVFEYIFTREWLASNLQMT